MLPLLVYSAISQNDQLQIDPLLLVQAAEVWSVIGRKNNPVWPGWDARNTPILIYFPGKQDVLINHPKPPTGFETYRGPLKSPIGPIFIKNGSTIKDLDGQNTSTEVGGIGTLVVADSLSSRRQWIESLSGRLAEKPNEANKLITDGLFPNPYDSMAMFAHEAFHVYQDKTASNKAANELDVLRYPSLSVENNIGFALESDFLAEAVKSKSAAEARTAAVKWLSIRHWRRQQIPAGSSAYEDGNEVSEGLSKYIEYKLMECLKGRKPTSEMWLVQGFRGYEDLTPQFDRVLDQVRKSMSGEMDVNGDPYGASPVRFRLYFSGMAAAIMLDRLGSKWHDPILKTNETLLSLVEKAVAPSTSELEGAKVAILGAPRYKDLAAVKEKLAKDGQAHIDSVLAAFDKSPGELLIDYSKLAKPRVGFGFTPFGVLRVSDDQTVFRLIPIQGLVGSMTISEDSARPVVQDRKAKLIRYQLTSAPDETAIKAQATNLQILDLKSLKLPGVELANVKGSLVIEGRRVVLTVAD